ncbi:MAG: hypothetical protein AABZ47_16765 [Planctomycetota bacterium]
MTDDLTPNQQPTSSTSRAESHLHNVLGQASSLTDNLANELGATKPDVTPSSPQLDLNEPESGSTPLDGQLEQIDGLLRDAEQELGSFTQKDSGDGRMRANASAPRHAATVPDFMNEFMSAGDGPNSDGAAATESMPSKVTADENYEVPDFMAEFTASPPAAPQAAGASMPTIAGVTSSAPSPLQEPTSLVAERSIHTASSVEGNRTVANLPKDEQSSTSGPRVAVSPSASARQPDQTTSTSRLGGIGLVPQFICDMLVGVLEALDRPLGWIGDRAKRTLGWLAAVMIVCAIGLYVWSRI